VDTEESQRTGAANQGCWVPYNTQIRDRIPNFYDIFVEPIAERVKQLLSLNGNDPYVDIEAIAKAYGITEILYVPPNEIGGDHARLEGTLILVNNGDSPEKQRFSIAHEILHFIQRGVGSGFQSAARLGEAWKKDNPDDPRALDEELADYFAANLLVPTERFIEREHLSNEELSHTFGVNLKCIEKRRHEIESELCALVFEGQPFDIMRGEQQYPSKKRNRSMGEIDFAGATRSAMTGTAKLPR